MILFGLATLIQLLFWGVLFSRLRREDAPITSSPPPLSVIVCARNEASHLASRLPDVLQQDYPSFEVIVVDHASTDSTPDLLSELQALYPHLRVIRCEDPAPGKKQALTLGIQAARHDWIALTDADCRPASGQWLKGLAARIAPEVDVILGYGPLEKKPGLHNAFTRFETALTAIQYGSYALAGTPYMGVGRNLAYRKQALKSLPSETHPDLVSGDDDLLVNAVARGANTRIAFSPETFTWSPAPQSWSAFFTQKNRHLTTGRHYRPVHQLLLGAWASSLLGHYALGLFFIFGESQAWVLAGYLIRQALAGAVFYSLAEKLAVRDLRGKFPLLDLMLFGYYLLMAPAAWWGKGKKWR